MAGGWREASQRIDFAADPTAGGRITAALLLRKARIDTVAALRANETSNLHSLAVQMRPVLECAGQVVFFFHNTVIAPDLLVPPERAAEVAGDRINADHYQLLRRRTRGEVSPEELRNIEAQAQEAAAEFAGAPKPKKRKRRRFNQIDKVAVLKDGRAWYRHLSNHFSHGNVTEWAGLSWRGGVMTIDRVEDEFAFSGLLDYLVQQVAVMNAHAALCPVAGDGGRPVEAVDRTNAGATARRAAVVEATPGCRHSRREGKTGWRRLNRLTCSGTGARKVATRFVTSLESMWSSALASLGDEPALGIGRLGTEIDLCKM